MEPWSNAERCSGAELNGVGHVRARSGPFSCTRSALGRLGPLEDDDSGDAGRPAVCFVFGHEIHVTAGGCWWRHATITLRYVTCNRRVNVVKRSEKGAVESRRGEEHGRGNRRKN
ncbi:hypothetical protein ALC57_15743 [Trachymyrmex cornetzi]|uniref:Uncharacterized protein n=1 Tax=Trachymyrmex cornetzi TaxID=471704 RepID=A0A151IW80_9HYME|nr:hypothetical protein ALC57_15743 [Trachymyrmex cornetzi]